MMKHVGPPHRPIAALGLVLAATACSAATAPEAIDDALLTSAAIVAADATLEDISLWSQPFGFEPAPAPVAATGRPGGLGGWSGELSGTREVTFYDTDGVEQDGYDPLATDVIHILHEISGNIERDGWSARVHRERDKTVSRLAGEEATRTWDGTGSEEVNGTRTSDDGVVRSHETIGTFTYEDVVVPIPGTEPRYPLSGTITRSMTMTVSGPSGERTRSVEVIVTFNGSAIVTALVNGEEMEIDLSTRAGGFPIRRRRG